MECWIDRLTDCWIDWDNPNVNGKDLRRTACGAGRKVKKEFFNLDIKDPENL